MEGKDKRKALKAMPTRKLLASIRKDLKRTLRPVAASKPKSK
jgi:hypothetical protein